MYNVGEELQRHLYDCSQESQPTTGCKSRSRSRCIRYPRAVINLLQPDPTVCCARALTTSKSLRMDPHVHTPIAEILYVVQYNPQLFVFQQAYTDAFNDQLSAADTEDYSDLPDLVDL